jgi:hypothetical protein
METRENRSHPTAQGSAERSDNGKFLLTNGEEEGISCRLGKLIDYVEGVTEDFDDQSQKILSDLIVALAYIERSGNSYLVGAAEVAVRAICVKPQKLVLARILVKTIKRQLLLYRLLGSSPSTAVAFGLSLFFYLLAPFSLFIVDQVRGIDFEALLGTSLGMLLLVSLAGALGSIVSVLIRVQNYAYKPKVWGPIPFVFTGLFKPIVGMAFAIFVFSIFNSGIIPVDVLGPENSPRESHFFLAVAFIAGFSERFAKDIAKGTEEIYSSPSEHEQPIRTVGSGGVTRRA